MGQRYVFFRKNTTRKLLLLMKNTTRTTANYTAAQVNRIKSVESFFGKINK
jgi:hypothetical protein